MKTKLRFIGMQETALPNVVVPLFNDDQQNTFSLGTCIERYHDFEITNHDDFTRELAQLPSAVFNGILVHAKNSHEAKTHG